VENEARSVRIVMFSAATCGYGTIASFRASVRHLRDPTHGSVEFDQMCLSDYRLIQDAHIQSST
jgi:hypothetical protein